MLSPLPAGPHDGHVWPSEPQELILAAALRKDERAERAFAAWEALVDVECEFDWQMVRLLPLVYSNLTALGIQNGLMPRLKGVYRRAWVENHQQLYRAAPAVAALCGAGIPVMLLKGAPMVLAYYGNHAHRPMSDLDVAVPAERAAEAMRLLQGAGWKPGPMASPTDERMRWTHAMQFVHPEGGELDLHWRVMVEATTPARLDPFWSTREPLQFGDHAVSMLAPTETLFHTVLHGVRWNEATPIRWIADALQVIATRGSDIDWERLCWLAQHLRVTYRLSLGLAYLASHHGVAVPEGALQRLRSTRPAWRERLEARILLADQRRWPKHFSYWYLTLLGDFARVADERLNPVAFVWTFTNYVRFRLELGGRRELVGIVARGLRRRIADLCRSPAQAADPWAA